MALITSGRDLNCQAERPARRPPHLARWNDHVDWPAADRLPWNASPRPQVHLREAHPRLGATW